MRIIAAFLVAPILPALPAAWFLHLNYPDRVAISGLVRVCLFFYLLQTLIGIPAYLLAGGYRRYARFYLLLGFFGMIAFCSAVIIFFSKTEINIAKTLLLLSYLGALGAGIGLVFWFVARPDRRSAKTAKNSS